MTVQIIPNLHILRYDPNKSLGAKVVTQDVNYGGSNTIRSVSKSLVRFIQDMNKRIIPTTPREGLGITTNGAFVEVSVGYAIINGRWVEVDALEQVDVSSLSDGDYYIILRASDLADGDSRDPELETVSVVVVSTSGYSSSSSDIVLAKITMTGGTPVISENYNIISNQFRVALIAPPISPDGSSYSQVVLSAGSTELKHMVIVDKIGTEFIDRIRLRDQNNTQEVSIRNINGEAQIRNEGATDNSYSSLASSQYKVETTVVISNSRELQNIVSLNTHAIPLGSDELVSVDANQTMTNKQITSPVISLPKLKDTSGNNTYDFIPSELISDRQVIFPLLTADDTIVFANHTQILTNKELTSPIISGLKIQDSTSHFYNVTVSNLSGDVSVLLPQLTNSDEFVFTNHIQTLTNKSLSSPKLVLPELLDTSQDNKYTFQPSELVSDVTVQFPAFSGNQTVSFTELAETLKNKTLDVATTVIKELTDNKSLFISLAPVANGSSVVLTVPATGTVVLTNVPQTLSNKTLISPTITTFVQSTHNHSDATNGGKIDHSDLDNIGIDDHHSQQHDINGSDHTGSLGVSKGGTGKTSLALNRVLFGNGTGAVSESNQPSEAQILVGQPSGNPVFKSVSGAITLDKDGVASINSSDFFIEAEPRLQVLPTDIPIEQSSVINNSLGTPHQIAPSVVIQLYGTKYLRIHSFSSNWELKVEYDGVGEFFSSSQTSKAVLLAKWGGAPSISDIVKEVSIDGHIFTPGMNSSVVVDIGDLLAEVAQQGLDGQSLYIGLAVYNSVALANGNVKASIDTGGALNIARLFGVFQI